MSCPLPDHQDSDPSCHVYDTAERGWCCYGCDRGGTIIDLGRELYGIEPRGRDYHRLLERISSELRSVAA